MFMKLFAGLALVAGLALSGLTASQAVKSCCYPGAECCFPGSPCCAGDNQATGGTCCYPGAECCFPGSPCCETCCFPGSECCYPGSPCCESCCYPGSECCFPGSPCCGSFVSTDAALKVKAGCGGCCTVQQAEQPAKADAKASKLVVDDMECAGCAKTVIKAVSAVAGVEAATADIKTKTLTVTPKAGKTPSPKDLWEAVEKAGYKPVKLDGPDGAFDKKPAK